MITSRIAFRYLFSRKSHHAVNIISWLSMAAIAVASAAMVIVLSVFNGFSAFTSDKLDGLDADLNVEPVSGKVVAKADSLAAVIAAIDGVTHVSPIVEDYAFAVASDRQMPLIIRGIDPEGSFMHKISKMTIDGIAVVQESECNNLAMSSVGVANALLAYPSNPISIKIYEPRRHGRLNPSNPMRAMRVDSVIVVGVYRVEQAEYDTDILVVPLSVARQLMEYTDEATRLSIDLTDSADINAVSREVSDIVGDGYVVKDRLAMQEHSMRMIAVEKWVTLLMLVFILVIASFNLLSTMSMIIVDKQPNRAILLAMGATPTMISDIFARLSFMITAIGGAVGIVIGLVLSLLQQAFGFIRLSADPSQLSITAYPVRVNALDTIIVIAIIAAIGAATALIIRAALRPRSLAKPYDG